jgi:hypothetical protein
VWGSLTLKEPSVHPSHPEIAEGSLSFFLRKRSQPSARHRALRSKKAAVPCADIVPTLQGSYHPCAAHTMWSKGEQGEQRRTPTSAAVSSAPDPLWRWRQPKSSAAVFQCPRARRPGRLGAEAVRRRLRGTGAREGVTGV